MRKHHLATRIVGALVAAWMLSAPYSATAGVDHCSIAESMRAHGLNTGETLARVVELCDRQKAILDAQEDSPVASAAIPEQEESISPANNLDLYECQNAQRYPNDDRLQKRCRGAIQAKRINMAESARQARENAQRQAVLDEWRSEQIDRINADTSLNLIERNQAIAALDSIPRNSTRTVNQWIADCEQLRATVAQGASNRDLESRYVTLRAGEDNVERAMTAFDPLTETHASKRDSCIKSEEYIAVAAIVERNEEYARQQHAKRVANNNAVRNSVDEHARSMGFEGVYWDGFSDYLERVRSGDLTLNDAINFAFPFKGKD